MKAPYPLTSSSVRVAELDDPQEVARLEAFVARHPQGTPFHRPAWFLSVARATGNGAHALVQTRQGEIVAFLPLDAIHSPVFGRVLASNGFAVGGGLVAREDVDPKADRKRAV